MPTVMTAGEIVPTARSRGAAASGAIREITSTVGCLLILPGASLVYKPRKGACDADWIPRNRDGRPPPPAGGRRARARDTPGTGHDGPGHGGARLPAGGRHRGYAAVAPDERRADRLGHRRGARRFGDRDGQLAAFHHPSGPAAA